MFLFFPARFDWGRYSFLISQASLKTLKIPYQKSKFEEEQTIHWPKEKGQNDKQITTQKTKDPAPRITLN